MLVKRRTSYAGAVAGLAMALGILLLPLPSHAGDAVMLVPDENLDLPQGSQIPEHRVKEIEKKVTDYKRKMRARSLQQQQQQSPKIEAPQPKAESPGKS